MKRIVILLFLGLLGLLLFACEYGSPTPTFTLTTGVSPTSTLTPTPTMTSTAIAVPSDTPTSEPTLIPTPDVGLHLLVEVTGDLSHERPGWKEPLPLSFGTSLDWDDLLRAAPDAKGLIVCADLSVTSVPADYYGGLPCPQETPILRRGKRLVANPQRGKPEDYSIPYVLGPRHTFIQTPHPLLRWHPSSTGTVTYTVQVWDGSLDWQGQTTATEWVYPDDAPPLEPGIPYYLVVVGGRHSSEEEKTSLDLSFVLRTPAEVAAVQSLVTQVQGLGLDERAICLLEAEIYAAHKLWADAIVLLEELTSKEDAPTVHRRLGDLYLEVGLYIEAQETYKSALDGYRALGQKDGEAHVVAGLGLAYRGDHDDATARNYLEQAWDLYKALGDADGMTRVENVLDEMGR